MSAAEDAAAAAADGGSGGGSSGAGSSEGGARRRFDDKGLVARTSLILWHTHQNDVGAVRKLLEEDAALVNARDYDSRTPLHVAALHGWHDVAECLIANGADVNSQDRWQNTVGGWEWGGPVSSDDPRLPLASAFDLHALSVLSVPMSRARFGSMLRLGLFVFVLERFRGFRSYSLLLGYDWLVEFDNLERHAISYIHALQLFILLLRCTLSSSALGLGTGFP